MDANLTDANLTDARIMIHASENPSSSRPTRSSEARVIPTIDWTAVPVHPDETSNSANQEFEETEQLERFLEAYGLVTGERLSNIDRDQKGERPDFICRGVDGMIVGIELTEVPHKGLLAWGRIFNPGMDMPSCELLDAMRAAIFKKQTKRTKGNWRPADKQLLVIILVEYAFDSFTWLCDLSLQQDLASTAFDEIWVCDNTTIDAHGASQLVGLHPQSIWGLYRPSSFDPKPFG